MKNNNNLEKQIVSYYFVFITAHLLFSQKIGERKIERKNEQKRERQKKDREREEEEKSQREKVKENSAQRKKKIKVITI